MIPTLDIVLPCFNPVASWTQRIVEATHDIQGELPEEIVRIILVNDGSKTGISTSDIDHLSSNLQHFLYLDEKENKGKGAALRKGIAASHAEICIFTDVDFPYKTSSFLSIFHMLKNEETDIAIGIKDPSYYSHLPWFRIQVSRFLRFLARTFMRISITDTQCGLKGFRSKGKKVFLTTSINRYLADLEFIFLSDRQPGLSMKSVPVSLNPGIEFSKVNPRILLREGINFLRVFFRSIRL